ncbi:SDR family NAD(P)-dependent oxidoreductase [Flavobacterium reichenbachii]|uniref:Uncharacterized protein n=1 Tax=Flavobacterium reichenbachii TaxID=362418 RepID=A0A085ZPH7_9FLAO|nr:SDR family NAD(P)-dependent oxidoreductase [Flavobacterium reichenbachii]KFF06341.1 hypothetical protein IW19_12800 [Flavobacterium reichenbachii]OXB17441.1 hypothetical protein B0A68_03860 [Flavobacterium reichenbachii]
MNNKIITIDFLHDNYILRDHKVYDVRIIPGVTYLDLVLRSSKKLFNKDFSLSRILFVEPLSTTEDYDRRLEITYSTGNQSEYEVVIRSQKIDHNGQTFGEWIRHMNCRIDSVEKLSSEITFDVENFIINSEKDYEMATVYQEAKTIAICHGEFMQTHGKIYQRGDEELMELHLSELAEEYREKMTAHPAFLDGATFAGSSFKLDDRDDSITNGVPYIPFSIQKFEKVLPFPSTVYVYSKRQPVTSDKLPEIIHNDIMLFNREGKFLASFEKIASKRIRDPESIKKLLEKPDLLSETKSPELQYKTTNVLQPQKKQAKTIEDKIKDFLKEKIAEKLDADPIEIGENIGFYDLGLDSNSTMALVRELESKCQHDFYPTLLFEYQTIAELGEYLLLNEKEHFADFESKEFIIEEEAAKDEVFFTNDLVGDSTVADEPIAIIGISGRYPMAKNISEFWENLKEGKNCITEIPTDRWDTDDNEKKVYNWGGFLDQIDTFDPLFFHISPKEAENMDPQVRLFLEESWKTLEDGGYTPEELSKKEKVGVFAGVFWTDYQLYRSEQRIDPVYPSSFVSLVANTVSSSFGFHGPSLGIDTQCSSSLTALHLACDSIKKGECTVALAGGVNLTSHPSKYNWLSNSMFLSSKGKCESFGKGGDGYVPGEGVGVVLLKSLSKAIKDGDQIYALIKGTAINHDGKSSGFTVPNPKAQALVIKEAIAKAKVDIKNFSYIEAHGTGTSLGDPIEIAGLAKIFNLENKQYCRIGSVKSNIGHCESAAGISGVTKVILQLKHKQLVPSINSTTLNPHIDFKNSAFRVQQELEEWKAVNDQPRLAGVSSFGAGGSNSHIILEEYIPKSRKIYTANFPAIIVLSAKNKNRLREQVLNLKEHLESVSDQNLYDIAYTLQIGRKAMEQRLAIVAENKKELLAYLDDYLNEITENCFEGNVKNKTINFELNNDSEDIYVGSVFADKNIEEIAKLWIRGLHNNWKELYGNETPVVVSLPTYPFAKEKYWISTSIKSNSGKLHALIHQNTSNLQEQKFTSVFNGTEPFFEDHKIKGEKILPGVAYVELARIAGNLSLDKKVSQITDITWLHPIKSKNIESKISIEISHEREEFGYEIYSEDENQIVHGHGKLHTHELMSPDKKNLDDIKQNLIESLDKKAYYKLFEELGFSYGMSFQGIESLSYNESEVLSKISLPKQKEYLFNLGMLDSALQTCAVLGINKKDQEIALPFKIGEISFYKELSEIVWCHTYLSDESNKPESKKYNIDLLSDTGDILISIKDFEVLRQFKKTASGLAIENEKEGMSLFKNVWKDALKKEAETVSGTNSQLILLAGASANLADKLREDLVIEVESIISNSEEEFFIAVFEKVQEKIAEKTPCDITIVYENQDYLEKSFVSGLLKTVSQETLKITGRTIGVDDLSVNQSEELSRILECEASLSDAEVRYINGQRQVKKVEDYNEEDEKTEREENVKIKKDGVYLITGGLGGLGIVFAKYLSEDIGAQVILTGRSEQEHELLKLQNCNYYQCDISDKKALEQLIAKIENKHQKLDGIIHSAGVIRDSFILKKTSQEIHQVFLPKIEGTKNLDEATKHLPLDFLIFFSSVSGVTGNIGQADYASANAYLNNYAEFRNNQRDNGLRKGKTLSINWPLWKDGGMQITNEVLVHLEKKWGLIPLPQSEGLESFHKLLNSKLNHGIVIYGKKKGISEKFIGSLNGMTVSGKSVHVAQVSNKESRENVTRFLKKHLAKELKIDQEKLELDVALDEYGIDSIAISNINNNLGEIFGEIPSTLFFEYKTLGELVNYFEREYEAALFHTDEKVNQTSNDLELPVHNYNSKHHAKKKRFYTQEAPQQKDIAIIGLSGIYPGSRNIAEFWKNLQDGNDLVSEIPEERWDLENFYDREKGKKGKSYSKWGGFIENIDKFDADFFNISPFEAEMMDPQERLFMQVVWEVIEDSGYTRSSINKPIRVNSTTEETENTVGVYVGVMNQDYQLLGIEERLKGNFITPTSNSSSIANRISYFYNFSGPSIGIDTMCSSSLTAIHLACESIQNNSCNLAIAGGVNIIAHPNKYFMLSQARFMSSEGKCKSFGVGGDGYVPGEGVGAILLKSLEEAKKDGDQIYAVIKGSAINHGGKTNGYTVPNPKAQSIVIEKAINKAGVKPENFSYIEAHGTGTSLGDPIEILGLNTAFQVEEKQYCSIGSVKSNIGHCESAAGIAGVTKLLLQLKYKQLVPSLHSSVINPNIVFEKTPFKVQQKLEHWQTTNDKPRLTAISSFGAGGSNAHIILEEFIKDKSLFTVPFVIIVLSSKSRSQLRMQVSNLYRELEKEDLNITAVAYTLQTGREAMPYRLATVVSDMADLKDKLSSYLIGEVTGFFENTDELKAVKDAIEVKSFKKSSKEHYDHLAQQWVLEGVQIDWKGLYENIPVKVSLPTYPFVKESYWIPIEPAATININSNEKQLHPLLHRNVSRFSDQKYVSLYTGSEGFLSDHKVLEESILPGVAYIELLRAAIAESSGLRVMKIENLLLLHPLKVNKATEVFVELQKKSDSITGEVYSFINGERTQHCQAVSRLGDIKAVKKFDIEALLTESKEKLQGSLLYEMLKSAGLSLGNSFQGVKELHIGNNYCLSELRLPTELGYEYSPGILDSVLHTIFGLNRKKENQSQLSFPYHIGSIEFYKNLENTKSLFGYAEFSSKTNSADQVKSYDVYLLNELGESLLFIKDFVALTGSGNKEKDSMPLKEVLDVSSMSYLPSWRRILTEHEIKSSQGFHLLITGTQPIDSHVLSDIKSILSKDGDKVTESIEFPLVSFDEVPKIYLLHGLTTSSTSDYINVESEVFAVVKELSKRYTNQPLQITSLTIDTLGVYSEEKISFYGSGISGFLSSVLKEEPKWNIRMIDMKRQDLKPAILESIFSLSPSFSGKQFCWRSGSFYELDLVRYKLEHRLGKLKKGGVYVLLGGHGGLGRTTTDYLITHYDAQIIWLGRRSYDATIKKDQDILSLKGKRPYYYQCDALSDQSIMEAYTQIKNLYGTVNGLFHCAIVLEDSLLAEMSLDKFERSYLPKSKGSHNLINAFKSEPLDFICFYSSFQSFWNGMGQSNYSAGCTYKDSYARYVEASTGIPSYSINWGYWGEVGVVSDSRYKILMNSMGAESISSNEGMQILEEVLSGEPRQVIAVKLKGKEVFKSLERSACEISVIKTMSTVSLNEVKEGNYETKGVQDIDVFKNISRRLLLGVLLDMGLETNAINWISIVNLQEKLRVIGLYKRLFEEIVSELSDAGYLERKGDEVRYLKSENSDFNIANSFENFLENSSENYLPQVTLLKTCLDSFSSILSGQIRATDVLFPSGSLDLVSPIYKGNAQMDYFNELISDSIVSAVASGINSLPVGSKIKLLEVGAGTGGTSEILFKKLEKYKDFIEYKYTDISHGFLFYAEDKYKEMAPYLSTCIFNIEESPIHQEIPLGEYDIVVGSNVVHATKNILNTLTNIKAVLKQGGMLFLNEISGKELFTTLTFGLLEGWWLYDDEELRLTGSPGLLKSSWDKVLKEAGFKQINFFPKKTESSLAQQMIVAKSDGMVKIFKDEKVKESVSLPSEAAALKTFDEKKEYTQKLNHEINKEELITEITAIVASTIKYRKEDFDINKSFMDYGFDSILGTTLVKNINEAFDIDLSPIDIFNYPTVASLSAYIELQYKEILEKKLSSNIALGQKNPIENIEELHNQTKEYQKIEEPLLDLSISSGSSYILDDEIAIIGMSGRYPKSKNLDEFWSNISQGIDCVDEVSKNRWDLNEHYKEGGEKTGELYCKWMGELSDVDKFDPLFFNISPTEAILMDPQHRIFLEECWKSFEDAGYQQDDLNGIKCGTYAGIMINEYTHRIKESGIDKNQAQMMTGNSNSIFAARVAYLLNLKGPAIAVDTACSSSLVSIHLACQALRSKEVDMAIAGGVSLYLSVETYKQMCAAGMLSPTGKCKSFDNDADGFVPGEGVGVVVLKRLKDAIRDNDDIKGVIIGSGINQDGKTNGITAPNANSQLSLMKEIYERYNIKPETISYVETHGTGTKLGDPIEIEALKKVFEVSNTKNYCGIGSVKSNIGHTSAAAGIASLAKVILQLKHEKIAPTINFENENELLNIKESAFYINKALRDWQYNESKPRRAAISSFGFSGTNAHIVIEEYKSKETYPSHLGAAIFPISAKNTESLKNQVKDLKQFLIENPEVQLHDIAYTLQVGRTPMEERLVCIASNVEELKLELSNYLDGNTKEMLQGNIKKSGTKFFIKGKAGSAYIKISIEEKELDSLGQLWVSGIKIDWTLLYQEIKFPKRISLPTYSFIRESYWVAEKKLEIKTEKSTLHPLLHTNYSSLKEQKFISNFSGEEFFIKNYKIKNKNAIPAGALLEMAREAGFQSLIEDVVKITDVNWLSPVYINKDSNEVAINLYQEKEETVYEIYSLKDGKEDLHNTGKLSSEVPKERKNITLESIINRATGFKNGKELYGELNDIGLYYNESFQVINKIYYGRNEAISQIKRNKKEESFILSPDVIDAAFQTCMANILYHKEDFVLNALKYIQEVDIYKSLKDASWCYVAKNNTEKDFDVAFLNEEGEILVYLSNFLLSNEETLPDYRENADEKNKLFYLEPKWDKVLLSEKARTISNHLVIIVGENQIKTEEISSIPNTTVKQINTKDPMEFSKLLFEEVSIIAAQDKSTKITVLHENQDWYYYSYATGIFRTFQLGNHQLQGQLLGVDSFLMNDNELFEIIKSEFQSTDIEVRYQENERESRTLQPIHTNQIVNESFKIKDDGVYIITGGAGGLGKIFAQYLSSKAKKCKIILVGRSVLSEEKEAEIANIQGAKYNLCDITDEKKLKKLIDEIREEFGSINGIIHAAGAVTSRENTNQFLKSIESSEVLLPKIKGTQYLDEFTKDDSLDFVIYFSSISGALEGAVSLNLSDYALANAFLSSFANQRNKNVLEGRRKGKTISINWPVWKDIGLYNVKSEQWTEEILGIKSLPADKGLIAFEEILRHDSTQVMVLYGEENKIIKHYKDEGRKEKTTQNISALTDQITQEIINITAEILTLKPTDIDKSERLAEYGFDSILLTKFAQSINNFYGLDIMPIEFFNHPTIEEIVQFLVDNYSETLSNNSNLEIIDEKIFAQPIKQNFSDTKIIPRHRNKKINVPDNYSSLATDDIAIIGLGAAFSGAKNSAELWSNIIEGELLTTTASNSLHYGETTVNYEEKYLGNLNLSEEKYKLLSRQQQMMFSVLGQAIVENQISLKELSSSSTGVFIGAQQVFINDKELNEMQNFQDQRSYLIPNKISFHLNLKGPSEVVNTSCTSAYVALHRAMQSISLGECDQAIVGGVNIIPKTELQKINLTEIKELLSNSNTTKSFSNEGTGFISSEGAGVIIIKSLKKAKADHNKILALIKSSAIFHGGKGFSLEAPSPSGIREAVIMSFRKAKINPETIDYIEAHGIANPFADAIELQTLNDVYKELSSNPDKKWHIGSIKPTIGHPEFASGIASLIKVVKAFENKKIPGISGLSNINNQIENDHSLILKDKGSIWEEKHYARRAALNGYAIGGVNAHIILEEYIDESIIPRDEFKNLVIQKSEPIKNSIEASTQKVNPSVGVNEINKEKIVWNEGELNIIIEEELKVIWAEVLELESEIISVEKSFFELGGHSLNAMYLLNQINEKFTVKLSLHQILSLNTIELMSEYISEKALQNKDLPIFRDQDDLNNNEVNHVFPKLNISTVKDHGDQQWFEAFHQQEKIVIRKNILEEHCFNMSFLIRFKQVDAKILERVIQELLKRHESLRTSFKIIDGHVKQYVEKNIPEIAIEYIDISNDINKDQLIAQIRKSSNNVRFDLEKLPLFHLKVVKYSEEMSGLLFTIDHIISDGVSMNILSKEIQQLYVAFSEGKETPLAPVKFQYKDYALWVNEFSKSEKALLLKEKYLDKIRNSISKTNDQYDLTYKEKLSSEIQIAAKGRPIDKFSNAYGKVVNLYQEQGSSYKIFVKGTNYENLQKLTSNNGSSIFMNIVSVFILVFYKINKTNHLRFSVPYSTRIFKEFEEMVGWFSTSIILALDINDSLSFKEFVLLATEEMFETSQNRFYPHEEILNDLDVPLRVLTPTFFNFITGVYTEMDLENFGEGHSKDGSGHFNLKGLFVPFNSGILFNLEYNREAYSAEDIDYIIQNYFIILDQLVKNEGAPISEILKNIPQNLTLTN